MKVTERFSCNVEMTDNELMKILDSARVIQGLRDEMENNTCYYLYIPDHKMGYTFDDVKMACDLLYDIAHDMEISRERNY